MPEPTPIDASLAGPKEVTPMPTPVPDAAEVDFDLAEDAARDGLYDMLRPLGIDHPSQVAEALFHAGLTLIPASPDASLSPAPGGRLAEATEALRSVRSQLFEDRWCYLCESEQHDPECPVLTIDAALARPHPDEEPHA